MVGECKCASLEHLLGAALLEHNYALNKLKKPMRDLKDVHYYIKNGVLLIP